MTEIITVGIENNSYPIVIDSNLNNLGLFFSENKKISFNESVAIITNETIANLYLSDWQNHLEKLGFKKVITIILKDGESYKNLETLNQIYSQLLENQFSRKSLLIALGGGVIGDMVGFAAATYQRGISFIQVPTTLLAQVDSSVGGKTAVNHPLGKNMIGAFYQPLAVFTEINTLKTLPKREFAAGIAEVIKHGCIYDKNFYDYLIENKEKLLNQDATVLKTAIKRSCEIKAEIVALDEKETKGKRALLNFGHTFAHAIEKVLGYGVWLHGEAVACGMVLAMKLSIELGFLQQSELDQFKSFLSYFNLPIKLPDDINHDDLINAMKVDKKNENNQIVFIILEQIGKANLANHITENLIRSILG